MEIYDLDQTDVKHLAAVEHRTLTSHAQFATVVYYPDGYMSKGVTHLLRCLTCRVVIDPYAKTHPDNRYDPAMDPTDKIEVTPEEIALLRNKKVTKKAFDNEWELILTFGDARILGGSSVYWKDENTRAFWMKP